MRLKGIFVFASIISIIWLPGMAFAAVDGVRSALSAVCGDMTNLLPPAAMLMVLIGAVVYAAGQVLGAETRA